MLQERGEIFGLTEALLSKEWSELARTLLTELEEEKDTKISSLKESVLNKDNLVGLHDSQLLQDDGFLQRSVNV